MSKKRGNGEGSIYQRKDGRWVGQYLVYLPRSPKYRYIYAKTRKEAAEKLTKAMADRNGGIVFDTCLRVNSVPLSTLSKKYVDFRRACPS